MSETQIQALLRLGRVLLVGLLTTLGLNLPELIDLFVLDVTLKVVLVPIITAAIEAVLLILGGGTVQKSNATPDVAVTEPYLDRPSILSV